MLLMGLPMRYPRFFSVLLVALGLAVAPTADARATDVDPLPDTLRQIETLADISRHASTAADLARRGAVVESLALRADLDHAQAGHLLDAIAGFVIVMTEAGERSGVLDSPEIDEILEMMLAFVASTDPQSEGAFAKAGYLTERAIVATRLLEESERIAMDALIVEETVHVVGPIERWRPLVERYFSPDRVEEALSIIDCESNGDPRARNPRSSAAGLFQFLDRTWSHSSEQAGFEGESPFSPEANIASAAWLVEYSLGVGDSPWAHWTCRP